MSKKSPSQAQLAYLQSLGYAGTCPLTMLEAAKVIDTILQKTGKGRVDERT